VKLLRLSTKGCGCSDETVLYPSGDVPRCNINSKCAWTDNRICQGGGERAWPEMCLHLTLLDSHSKRSRRLVPSSYWTVSDIDGSSESASPAIVEKDVLWRSTKSISSALDSQTTQSHLGYVWSRFKAFRYGLICVNRSRRRHFSIRNEQLDDQGDLPSTWRQDCHAPIF